jgi:hypothetical protein
VANQFCGVNAKQQMKSQWMLKRLN